MRCYLAHRGLDGPRQRALPRRHCSYGLMRQSSTLPLPTDSLGQRVCAGCCQPRLGGGPSRRYLCVSFPACLDPYPGGSYGARTRFFPHDSGLPPVRTGSALHNARTATSVRRPFSRLQSFAYVQARRFARHPSRSYRHKTSCGSRGFYVRASLGLLPPRAPDMLTVRIGQLTV